jgi:hypothetical protein
VAQAPAGRTLRDLPRGPAVHVDHDHRTNQVRGMLCFNCNRGLGYLDDDLVTLYRAADYLESHGGAT